MSTMDTLQTAEPLIELRTEPVPVVSAKVTTLTAEQEIFDLINFGGVAQDETD